MPDEPPSSPGPGTKAPPTLSELCLAYGNEHLKEEPADKKTPKPHESRPLKELELGFLTEVLESQPADAKKSGAEELKLPLTVHDVVRHCGEWFPDGVYPQTVPADITALMDAAAAKAPSAQEAEDLGK